MNKDQSPARQPPGVPIDWSQVHQQVEETRQTLANGAVSTQLESRAILKARAQALAREPQQAAAAQDCLELVEFRLATETYGLKSKYVREIYPLKEFTSLPGVPPFVLGIVYMRGQILSVLDLKKFFDLPEKGLGQLNKLIILHSQQMEFGVLADDIVGTRSIPLETIQAAPLTVSGIGAEYLRGVTSGRVIILNALKILEDEKIVVHQDQE